MLMHSTSSPSSNPRPIFHYHAFDGNAKIATLGFVAPSDAAMAASDARTHFIIGSRKSDLALWQARAVKALLESAFPARTFEIRTESSLGDRVLTSTLSSLASAHPGLFTKELEVGLAVSAPLF